MYGFFLADLDSETSKVMTKKKMYPSPYVKWCPRAPFLTRRKTGENKKNSRDNYLFLEISQIWQKRRLITLLPPQYVVLPPTDHKRAGERHSLRDLSQNSSIHLNYLYHYLDIKYIRYTH